jgi:hypothetical protein
MSTISNESTVDTSAPAGVAWAILVDTDHWPDWSVQEEAELEREGQTDRNGVGAIRKMRTGRYTVREEVTEFDAPRRFTYKLLSGMPVRDYSATVTLEPQPSGTRITWRNSYRPSLPLTGPLLRRRLGKVIDDITHRLAARADATATGGDQPEAPAPPATEPSS